MSENTAIWDALGKTDPKHTKPFNRSGGFKGTAIKPIWILKMLTDQFGPAGIGWGVNKPEFQVVPADGEILVYCTVSAWHGDRANLLWGVGGDKVQASRSSGKAFTDDEAFKKAFTDAVNNAFKSLGVGADVHMGQFDDDKYVAQVSEDFEAKAQADEPKINDGEWAALTQLIQATGSNLPALLKFYKIKDLRDMPASRFGHAQDALLKKKKAA